MLEVKNPPAYAGDKSNAGLIPGLERSHGGGNGKPHQYSCLENPMNKRAWRATVLKVPKSWHNWSDSIAQQNNHNLNVLIKCILEAASNLSHLSAHRTLNTMLFLILPFFCSIHSLFLSKSSIQRQHCQPDNLHDSVVWCQFWLHFCPSLRKSLNRILMQISENPYTGM